MAKPSDFSIAIAKNLSCLYIHPMDIGFIAGVIDSAIREASKPLVDAVEAYLKATGAGSDFAERMREEAKKLKGE